jgi:hypothetical protein
MVDFVIIFVKPRIKKIIRSHKKREKKRKGMPAHLQCANPFLKIFVIVRCIVKLLI